MLPTERFSTRVESYIRYRPGYPEGVFQWLESEGLQPAHVIADIGCGTGISAEPFLRRGHAVLGIEPNREMRDAGERLLRAYPRFRSMDGTAERTGLPDRSVDWIVAGQAFHWFRFEDARSEFLRILRPGGSVALLWNTRRTSSTPFLAAYERLLHEYGTDYARVNHADTPGERIAAFFAPGSHRLRTFENLQRFDFEGLRGRLLSSSYAPDLGHPRHEAMLEELRRIFDTNRDAEGLVSFEYDTEVHLGRLE